MAKKTKLSPTKKFAVVGGVLIVAQIAFLGYFSAGNQPKEFRDVMTDQVNSNPNIAPEERSKVKVHLAIQDFRSKNNRFPNDLSELVPEYFEAIPIDPETAEPFKYTVDDVRYVLGEQEEKTVLANNDPSALKNTSEGRHPVLEISIENDPEEEQFVYDPTGKRDPFQAFDFSPKKPAKGGDTPLEQFGYDELKFAAMLEGFGKPKALVETPEGKGYTVSVGTRIGQYAGEIVEIFPDRLVILETTTEFTGEKKTRTVEMYIR